MKPLYDPAMWSIYDSFFDDEVDATTSVLEAFHRGWNSWADHKPTFESFIGFLKDQQTKSECRIAQSKKQAGN